MPWEGEKFHVDSVDTDPHPQAPEEVPVWYDLTEMMGKTFGRCLEMARHKNLDYAGTDDAFACFRLSELVGVPVEKGIFVRLLDKVSRASNLLDTPAAVETESLRDTLEDMINYAAILIAWLERVK